MDDDGVQGNESVADGVFEEIAAANHEVYASRGQLDKAANDPAATGATGGGTPAKQKEKTSDEEEVEGDNAHGLDTQDFSHEIPVEEADTTEAQTPSDENSQTNTETQAEAAEEVDWKAGLPPDPGEFTLEAPKPDENGLIDPADYGNYIRSQIRFENSVEKYNEAVINATFETVEKILPEIKTSPAYKTAIKNTFDKTLSGEEVVKLAREFRASIDEIAGKNKAAGVQNAKTSISIQKNAAVETKGASQKPSKTDAKSDNLSKRLSKGDTSAFEELMGNWLEEGKV